MSRRVLSNAEQVSNQHRGIEATRRQHRQTIRPQLSESEEGGSNQTTNRERDLMNRYGALQSLPPLSLPPPYLDQDHRLDRGDYWSMDPNSPYLGARESRDYETDSSGRRERNVTDRSGHGPSDDGSVDDGDQERTQSGRNPMPDGRSGRYPHLDSKGTSSEPSVRRTRSGHRAGSRVRDRRSLAGRGAPLGDEVGERPSHPKAAFRHR